MADIWGTPRESRRRKICMLMITHACNLNCTYCYEPYKSKQTMSFDLAKHFIQKECQIVKNDPQFDEIEIDLMGGEPMMNFPLIKQLVEWAESIKFPVPYIFFLTSNGTLFDEEAKSWFSLHKQHICAGISYDGTTAMQRQNRGSVSKSIDIDFFKRTWPDQGFHMTVSQETLPNYAEGVLELQRSGVRLNTALAQGIDWNENDARIYLEQLRLLEEAYLNEPDLCPISTLTKILYVCSTTADLQVKQTKYCGTGTHMVAYDVDGASYGCHMFTPIVMGDDAVERDHIVWQPSEPDEDQECKNCILKRICPSCAGFNLRFRGGIACRDHRWCKLVLVQTLCACEFQIQILLKRRQVLNETDAARGRAALNAYSVLKNFSLNSQPPFNLSH